LRRTFSNYWIRNATGPNPALVKDLLDMQLGHSRRTITDIHYLSYDVDDVLAAYVSPLDAVDCASINMFRSV
jgi:integrase